MIAYPYPQSMNSAYHKVRSWSCIHIIIEEKFSCTEGSYTVLTLCRQAKALKVRNHVIGAKGSRHSLSSLVLAKRDSSRVELAEIQYFSECVVKLGDHSQAKSFWVACVNYWYLEHPCKVWYGNPVEVWSTVPSPVISFIPVKNILSRLVYAKCTRDFGRMLVNDTVFVVTPLISN